MNIDVLNPKRPGWFRDEMLREAALYLETKKKRRNAALASAMYRRGAGLYGTEAWEEAIKKSKP